MNKTVVVNMLAGPGSGKSTMASSVFSELKWRGEETEYVGEYAKDLTWEHRMKTLSNQVYVFAKQHHRIFNLLNQVDIIVTDSPLYLTPIYCQDNEPLTLLMFHEMKKWKNLNIYINRKKDYNPNGRQQKTIEDAIKIDDRIKSFLHHWNIPHFEVDGTPNGIKFIVEKAIELKHEN
jgi:hypothetical protein